jgi:hypothetical protein
MNNINIQHGGQPGGVTTDGGEGFFPLDVMLERKNAVPARRDLEIGLANIAKACGKTVDPATMSTVADKLTQWLAFMSVGDRRAVQIKRDADGTIVLNTVPSSLLNRKVSQTKTPIPVLAI